MLLSAAPGEIFEHMRAKVVILVVLALAAGVLTFGLWIYYHDTDLGDHTVSIVIEPGDGFSGVAGRLAEEGVVDSRLALKIAARLRGVDRTLIPGRYDFSGHNSVASVLDRLARGDFLRVKVTIPEGSPIWKVASILSRTLQLDSASIVNLNEDSAFLASVEKPSLEGYLYPETYHFQWGIGEKQAVRNMISLFHAQTDTIWPDSIIRGLTRYQILILASIIESETPVDSERTIVSSVYHNRLRKNWRLDADPTVIYGLGGLDRPLYRRDLRKQTPYNTYMHRGLPPTPINSPGIAAIRAALYPAETDYFFFVADRTGGHDFSRTNAEHERAKRRIRQARP